MNKRPIFILMIAPFIIAANLMLVARAQSSDASRTIAIFADSSVTHVETFDFASRVFGNSRTIRVFLPESYNQPGHENQRYPVLYMNDGFAVFKPTSWNAPHIIQHLIRQKNIPELILVGIDNGATARGGSPDQRTNEYLPYADTTNEPSVPIPHGSLYPDFLLNEVMPAVAQRYRVKTGAANTGLGGSSYGALAVLYTAIHHPGVFGQLLLESTPTFMANDKAFQEAKQVRVWPIRVYIGIGTNETDDENLNKNAVPNAQRLRDIVVTGSAGTVTKLLVGHGDSHNSRSWSRRFPEAIEFLFGSVD